MTCRACGAPDHPAGCAQDVPNLLAVRKRGLPIRVSIEHPLIGEWTATPHEHQWVDVTELQDADRQERCIVRYCDAARTVPQ